MCTFRVNAIIARRAILVLALPAPSDGHVRLTLTADPTYFLRPLQSWKVLFEFHPSEHATYEGLHPSRSVSFNVQQLLLALGFVLLHFLDEFPVRQTQRTEKMKMKSE